MRIYITHCCAKKDNSLAQTGREVTPDKLYTATPIKRFIQRCKDAGVRWAIFSDHYGVWFGHEEHEWYGDEVGDPNWVSEAKFIKLSPISMKSWRILPRFISTTTRDASTQSIEDCLPNPA